MIYLCTVCNEEVSKPPLVSVEGWRSASPNDFEVGLGKWHCRCGNNKVKAVKGQSTNVKVKSPKKAKSKFKAKKGKASSNARTTNSGNAVKGSAGGLQPQSA